MRLFIVSRDWETNEKKREIQNKRKNSELRTQASHAFIYWKREKSKKGKRKIEKGRGKIEKKKKRKGIRERREERKKKIRKKGEKDKKEERKWKMRKRKCKKKNHAKVKNYPYYLVSCCDCHSTKLNKCFKFSIYTSTNTLLLNTFTTKAIYIFHKKKWTHICN